MPRVLSLTARDEPREDPAVRKQRRRRRLPVELGSLDVTRARSASRSRSCCRSCGSPRCARAKRDALRLRRVAGEREAQRVGAVRGEALAHLRRRRIRLLELCERFLGWARRAAPSSRSSSKVAPWIRSSGSITFPFTLLILSPVSSTTMPCEQHAPERHLPHEVEAHHHHAGDPEEEDVVARLEIARRIELRERASSPASRASRTARARSRTRCRARRRPARARRRRTARSAWDRRARRSRVRTPCSRTPGSGDPTRAGARCTSPGCSSSQWSYVFAHSSGMIRVRPSRTASSAGSASGFIFTNHCVEIIGSTMAPERCERGSVSMCGFVPRARPFSSSRFFTALRATNRSSPANSPAFSFMRAVELEDVDLLEPVALAGREVVEVVRGRHLHGAGAERHVDEHGIGDDRDFARDERVHELLAVQVLVARVVRVHGDGGVAEHRFRARRRDDELGRSERRVASATWYANSKSSPCTFSCVSTSRSESTVRDSTSQLMRRVAR